VIAALGDRIDHWHVAPTPGPRGCDAADIVAALHAAGRSPNAIHTYPDLAAAFEAARDRASADDRIAAFGSFLTVAEVMRAIRARPAAVAA
jgi:dihydrofolate synthase/folylpolyglutamate synthase